MYRFSRRRRGEVYVFVLADDNGDDLTDVHDFVHLAVCLRELAGLRHRDVGHDLVSLDLQQRFTFFDLITGLVVPLKDFSFVNAFADVGN